MFFKKKKQLPLLIYAPVTGKVINLSKVEDPVFAQEMLGTGFAIIPEYKGKDGVEFVSPFDGKLATVFNTGHAYGIKDVNTGIECLVHIGIDTVELAGKGFDIKVEQGKPIKKSEVMVVANLQEVKNKGKKVTTPIVFSNETMEGYVVKQVVKDDEQVTVGQLIAEVTKK
ncbi:PTS glucose transporter subunit IIA [Spiroplasma endosymbiont of Tricholauxania praeusta]|uniref:PTS sugar transporter subunit IIA n=1 Tax=Spiroplasma endosymbiont of Tricholauxania praeusta TaxID=3066296 RepID=UPI0030D0B883